MLNEFLKSQFYCKKSPNLLKLGFDFNSNPKQEYFKIQEMLVTKYLIECESMLTIMKMFQIPSSRTMDIIFRLFNIESRSFSEATSNAYLQNRKDPNQHPHYVNIWHNTWYGKQVLLRSSFEEQYAKLLDQEQTFYEVECMRIKYFDDYQQKYRIAIPDFYIPISNTIVEIKSTYWYDEPNMISKFKEYQKLGFNTKLILDFKEHLVPLGNSAIPTCELKAHYSSSELQGQ